MQLGLFGEADASLRPYNVHLRHSIVYA